MAVIAPPELQSLFVNKNGKYCYVMTYTSKWENEKKNSKKTSSKTVALCVKLVCDISSIFASYLTLLNVTAFFFFPKIKIFMAKTTQK